MKWFWFWIEERMRDVLHIKLWGIGHPKGPIYRPWKGVDELVEAKPCTLSKQCNAPLWKGVYSPDNCAVARSNILTWFSSFFVISHSSDISFSKCQIYPSIHAEKSNFSFRGVAPEPSRPPRPDRTGRSPFVRPEAAKWQTILPKRIESSFWVFGRNRYEVTLIDFQFSIYLTNIQHSTLAPDLRWWGEWRSEPILPRGGLWMWSSIYITK